MDAVLALKNSITANRVGARPRAPPPHPGPPRPPPPAVLGPDPSLWPAVCACVPLGLPRPLPSPCSSGRGSRDTQSLPGDTRASTPDLLPTSLRRHHPGAGVAWQESAAAATSCG